MVCSKCPQWARGRQSKTFCHPYGHHPCFCTVILPPSVFTAMKQPSKCPFHHHFLCSANSIASHLCYVIDPTPSTVCSKKCILHPASFFDYYSKSLLSLELLEEGYIVLPFSYHPFILFLFFVKINRYKCVLHNTCHLNRFLSVQFCSFKYIYTIVQQPLLPVSRTFSASQMKMVSIKL